jgi:DNA-binding ferritin-like protein (Dps family)
MNKLTKKLNQHNNELEKQINTESQEAFKDISCYLRGADISEYNQEVVRQDLLDMILSAQKRGENIQSVIEVDYKDFCDDIIANLPPKNIKEKVVEFLDILCLCLSILCTINIIMADETIALIRNFATGKILSYGISISVGSIISAIFIIIMAMIIVKFITKNAFYIGKKETVSTFKVFFLCASIMAILLFISWVGKATLFTINIFAACVFTLILYIIHRILAIIQ